MNEFLIIELSSFSLGINKDKTTPINNAIIGFTNRPKDEDLQQFVAVHRSDGTDPTYVTTSSTPNFGIAITDTGKEVYRGFDDLRNGGIASTDYFPGTSSTAGTTNKLVFYSEDHDNAGSEDDAVKGNVVSLKRYLPYTEEDFWKDLPDENSIGYSMAKKNLIIQLNQ